MTTIKTEEYRGISIEVDYSVGYDGRRYLEGMRYRKGVKPMSDDEIMALDRFTFLKLGMLMHDLLQEHSVKVRDAWRKE